MNYTVIWTRHAESGLADAWLDAADRESVTAASTVLDDGLGETPFDVGSPRGSTVRRYAIFLPLGITCDRTEDDKKVSKPTCRRVG